MKILDIEDSMLLWGIRKGRRVSMETLKIEIEAENAWLEGLDADANPYDKYSNNHYTWYRTWLNLNRNC